MKRPPGGTGDRGRQRIAVGHPDGPEDDAAGDRTNEYLSPHWADREAIASLAATGRDQRAQDPKADHGPEDPARPLPQRADIRSDRTAPQHLEGPIEWRDGLALRVPEDETAPDQEAAQGHDERGHAPERDDESLQSPDGRAERDPEQQGDHPGVRLLQTETKALRDPDGLKHRHRVSKESQHRSDGEIDIPRHDDEDHPRGHDRDRGALDRQVPEVPRGEERPARNDVEADPDHDQRAEHAEHARVDLN